MPWWSMKTWSPAPTRARGGLVVPRMGCNTIQVSTQLVVEPSTEAVATAVTALKLLADETRLRIVWNLLHGEHNVNELAEHLGMHAAAISHHLARLRFARVVRTRRDGNRIFYAVHDPHIAALVSAALLHTARPQPGHHHEH